MKNRILSLIVCALFAVTLLFSCGERTPEATVDGYMKACVEFDREKMNEFFPTGAEDQDTQVDDDTYTIMFKRIKYGIGTSEITGDTATVNVTITTLDMKTIMGEIISDLIGQAFSHIGDDSFDSDAYANELLAEKMNAEDAPTVTNEAVVNLNKDGSGKWIISDESQNTDFIDALTGGLMSMSGVFDEIG